MLRLGLVTDSSNYKLEQSLDRNKFLGRISHVSCVLKGPVWLREKHLSIDDYERLAYDAVDAIASEKGEGEALPFYESMESHGPAGRLYFNHPSFATDTLRVIAMETHARACRVDIGWHFDGSRITRLSSMAELISHASVPVHDVGEAMSAVASFESALKVNSILVLDAIVSPLFATSCKSGIVPLDLRKEELKSILEVLRMLKIYHYYLGGISSSNLNSEWLKTSFTKGLLTMSNGMKTDEEKAFVEFSRIMSAIKDDNIVKFITF